ncbi:hypothetical protein HK096_010122, partial [Nowakowskiella sp. JEL0078]
MKELISVLCEKLITNLTGSDRISVANILISLHINSSMLLSESTRVKEFKSLNKFSIQKFSDLVFAIRNIESNKNWIESTGITTKRNGERSFIVAKCFEFGSLKRAISSYAGSQLFIIEYLSQLSSITSTQIMMDSIDVINPLHFFSRSFISVIEVSESNLGFKVSHSKVSEFLTNAVKSLPDTVYHWMRLCIHVIEILKNFEKFIVGKNTSVTEILLNGGKFRKKIDTNKVTCAKRRFDAANRLLGFFSSECDAGRGKQLVIIKKKFNKFFNNKFQLDLEKERMSDLKDLDIKPRNANFGVEYVNRRVLCIFDEVALFFDSKEFQNFSNNCISWFLEHGGEGWLWKRDDVSHNRNLESAVVLSLDSNKKSRFHTSKERSDAAKIILRYWRKYMSHSKKAKEISKKKNFETVGSVSDLNTMILGKWCILLADKAQTALKRIAKNDRVLKSVLKNLSAIANGIWLSSVAKPLKNSLPLQVFEAKVLKNLRIVWNVDVAYCDNIHLYQQVIKVWSITDHAGVVKTLERLWQYQLVMSDEHKRRCKIRRKNSSENEYEIMEPETFMDDGGDMTSVVRISEINYQIQNSSGTESKSLDLLMLHDMMVTAKFITLSKIFVNYLFEGKNSACEFIFALNETEHEVIRHPGSVLCIGRSGTGKTTCSLFRLLSMFHTYHSRASTPLYSQPSFKEGDQIKNLHLRQIFITSSPILCARVKNYFGRLVKALEISKNANLKGKSAAELFFQSVKYSETKTSGKVRKQSSFIEEMVDEVDKLLKDDAQTEIRNGDDQLIQEDAEDDMMKSVPDSFSDLTDDHFPLFLTYRKYVSMIRNALGFKKQANQDNKAEIIDSSQISRQQMNAMIGAQEIALENDINYFHFLQKYWSKLSVNGMDPSLVFSEIMGVVKGSEVAAHSSCGYMTREEYVGLSEKSFS